MFLQGIIFDMDGVLVETSDIHQFTEIAILADLGITVTAEELILKFAGCTDTDMFQQMLIDNNITSVSAKNLSTEKWKRIYSDPHFASKINILPGVHNLINQAYLAKIPMAIASGSPRAFIETVMQKLDISHKISVYLSGEEMERGKPDPLIFQTAATALGAEINQCVVIEDSLTASTGAANRGFKTVGITHNRNMQFSTNIAIPNLSHASLQTLQSMFNLV